MYSENLLNYCILKTDESNVTITDKLNREVHKMHSVESKNGSNSVATYLRPPESYSFHQNHKNRRSSLSKNSIEEFLKKLPGVNDTTFAACGAWSFLP